MIDSDKFNKILKENNKKMDTLLSQYAFQNNNSYRKRQENMLDVRTAFAIDRDRILYSGAYRRYQGKTQVFAFTNLFDEEMTNRSLHTTYVSQISRTIGKALHLNTELIEAIALGHDLGHTPFGHDGERALSEICYQNDIGYFFHNIESLYIVDHISKKGKGMNLTFQVRDGIISHDGEEHSKILKPSLNKTEEDIISYISKKKKGEKANWMPATLEGCVVRISDTIAYIGQDIEDAIRSNLLKRNEIPKECRDYLGEKNSRMIDTLVKSVIVQSYQKGSISFDDETAFYLKKLKEFNYERIYRNQKVKNAVKSVKKTMQIMFEKYMEDVINNNYDSKIYKHFLNQKISDYLVNFSNSEKVRDFIATMTDRYFSEEVKDFLLPGY